ncbi:MAG: DUF4139 domain-containing protein [Myxococcales bacterium]|nr:DUF4139 domain-containing protein [Myxococcales bacterium]
MHGIRGLALLGLLSCAAAGATDGARDTTAARSSAGGAASHATPPEPPSEATPAPVTRVAIFKNGYGFVFRRVEVRGGETVRVDGAPRAVLGTLWAYPVDGDVSVRGFRATEGRGTEERDCALLPDLLRSSVGKRVRLSRTTEQGTQTHVGAIERVVGDDLFLLRTECPASGDPACAPGGLLAFAAGPFDAVVFLDDPPAECSAEVDRTQLVIDVGGRGAGTIEYTALEQGLKWVPEYRVERLRDDKVRITLQGALVNDAVDLVDAEVDLVVGVPHYLMSGTLSPLVLEGALQDVVASRYAPRPGAWSSREWNSNVVQTQMVMPYDQGNYGGAGEVEADLGGVDAAEADELNLYRVEHVTLAKGERSLVRVFSVEVPVEDIYKWDVAGMEADALAMLQQASAGDPSAIERVAQQRVWHHLRIQNRSDQAWTTGPAVYFADGKVVAQDRITYTPAGAAVDVRLTMATDLLVQWDDTEDRRDRAAKQIDDVWWDLVTAHGELSVRSHLDRAVELVVVRRMIGTISNPSDGGTVHAEPGGGAGGWSPYLAWGSRFSDYGYLYYDWGTTRVNSPTWCEWKLTLRPNAEKRLTYQFRYYTR